MYRGITLSNAVSKLFEAVLVSLFGDSLQSSDYNRTIIPKQKPAGTNECLIMALNNKHK